LYWYEYEYMMNPLRGFWPSWTAVQVPASASIAKNLFWLTVGSDTSGHVIVLAVVWAMAGAEIAKPIAARLAPIANRMTVLLVFI